jgi:hypothetical protein|tara:strand:+ start:264 stop:473 length:210 start_codon:yes stop_codon:yes gene_type:complete
MLTKRFLTNIKIYLQNEVDRTELYEQKFCETDEDFILYGRQDCASGLLELIKEMEKGKTDEELKEKFIL